MRPENCVLAKPCSYQPETRLVFLNSKRQYVDSVVVEWLGADQGSKHKLLSEDGTTVVADLNVCNHAIQQFESAKDYEELRQNWCAAAAGGGGRRAGRTAGRGGQGGRAGEEACRANGRGGG